MYKVYQLLDEYLSFLAAVEPMLPRFASDVDRMPEEDLRDLARAVLRKARPYEDVRRDAYEVWKEMRSLEEVLERWKD